MTPKQIISKYRKQIRRAEASCGIYFLVKDSMIVYIGQSTRLQSRIESHREDKDFDDAFYFECPREELDDIERELIRGFSPRYNIAHNYELYRKVMGARRAAANQRLAEDLARRIQEGKFKRSTIASLEALNFLKPQRHQP